MMWLLLWQVKLIHGYLWHRYSYQVMMTTVHVRSKDFNFTTKICDKEWLRKIIWKCVWHTSFPFCSEYFAFHLLFLLLVKYFSMQHNIRGALVGSIYLCLFVQHILCSVFDLGLFVLCTICCHFLWVDHIDYPFCILQCLFVCVFIFSVNIALHKGQFAQRHPVYRGPGWLNELGRWI